MIVRHIVEISEDDVMTYHFYYLTTTSNDFELPKYEVSNPRPGLTPGTALCAVSSGTNESLLIKPRTNWTYSGHDLNGFTQLHYDFVFTNEW